MQQQDFIENYDRYKAAFDGALDVIMITNGKNGEIIDINNAANTVFGYTPSELIGKHFSVLFPNIAEDRKKNLIDELNIYGSTLSYREIKKKDGSICLMDLNINVVKCGKKKIVLTNFRDASERAAAEAKIKQLAEELKILNLNKDRLFSIISHDMKNAFTGLLGYASLLNNLQLNNARQSELKSLISELNTMSIQIYRLFENLLQWSSFNTGNLKFEQTEFDLIALISAVINIFSMQSSKKNIRIEFIKRQVSTVFADYNMIRSVLQNLLSNAIKFTNSGGIIEISIAETAHFILVSVKDNGIGINPKKLKTLFSLETNRSTPGTDNEKGVGLGLLLCKELIEKNNGKICVESVTEKYTIFTVSIPKSKH